MGSLPEAWTQIEHLWEYDLSCRCTDCYDNNSQPLTTIQQTLTNWCDHPHPHQGADRETQGTGWSSKRLFNGRFWTTTNRFSPRLRTGELWRNIGIGGQCLRSRSLLDVGWS